jgi:hypothetical protein
VNRKISVLVEVDLDGQYVRINVTGALTEVNQQGLYPVLRRARTMLPGATVTVDLTCVHHLEPAALDLLRWAADQDESLGDAVEILAPETAPAEPAVAALEGRRRLRSKVLQRRSAELPVPLPELALGTAS